MVVKEGHLQINNECQQEIFAIVARIQIRFNNSQINLNECNN